MFYLLIPLKRDPRVPSQCILSAFASWLSILNCKLLNTIVNCNETNFRIIE